jgi:hypothetical protein
MHAVFATVFITLLCVIPARATAAIPTLPACSTTLTCTAEDIDRMSIPVRLAFVRAMSAGPAAELLPGRSSRWRNIEGVLEFFGDHDLGDPGTWVSYVDAGIVEGVERGIALALGRGGGDFANPGSPLWANYLTDLAHGRLTGRAAHDRAWSQAEQASTEYGVALAERGHGLSATVVEERFYEFSEFYRWTLRNRPAIFDFTPAIGPNATFLDWFTDVTNDVPTRRGAEIAYSTAAFDFPSGTVAMLALCQAYAVALLSDYFVSAGQTR